MVGKQNKIYLCRTDLIDSIMKNQNKMITMKKLQLKFVFGLFLCLLITSFVSAQNKYKTVKVKAPFSMQPIIVYW